MLTLLDRISVWLRARFGTYCQACLLNQLSPASIVHECSLRSRRGLGSLQL